MLDRRAKLTSALHELAAEYFNRETNRQSLITVTSVTLKDEGRTAIIAISVLPDDKAAAALDFAHRQLSGLRGYMMENLRARHIPWLEVVLSGQKQ